MHIAKYNLLAGKLEIGHAMRLHKTYKNKDIDFSKTEQNYHFNEIDPLTKLQNRINDIYIYGKNGKHKNDINYLCSVCIHYPKDCSMDEESFFCLMNDILTKKFGADNVINSVVHKDENRPHMHFQFMPVIYNDKKDRYELCCKKVINRNMLQHFHEDIENEFAKNGYIVKLHDSNNLQHQNINDIEDYKKYKDKIKSLENEYDNLENEYNDLANEFNDLQDVFNKMNNFWDKNKNIMLPLLEENVKNEYFDLVKECEYFFQK